LRIEEAESMATPAEKKKDKEPLDFDDMMKSYNPALNQSVGFLTLYEKTSIMSLRMQQLANGAPSLLDKTEFPSLRALAEAEMRENKLPLMVCRKMPNGKKEYWRLEDLIQV
jgi:DNA-directed RNA polymerase subunit K/omega